MSAALEEALCDALAREDHDVFDRAAEALGGGRGVLAALLAGVSAEERASIEARLPPRPQGAGPFTPRVDVAALAARGPTALWIASEWILRVVPRHERFAPAPAHEQWDALVEIHRARVEAPWLVIELLASLDDRQRGLGRRIVLGLDRRFGARGRRVCEARLRLGGVVLHDLLPAPDGEPRT